MVIIKAGVRWLVALIVIILTYTLSQTEWFPSILSGDIHSIVKENKYSMMLITLMIMVIQNTFTIIPLLLIISINYSLFGFINGFLWSWFTSIIGAALMFYGSRYLLQSWVINKVKDEWLKEIEANGFIFVFQGRIIPFIPTSLINIVSGISTIKFKSFINGTIIGNFLYFFILTLVPAGLMKAEWNESIIITILALSIIFYLYYRKKKKKVTYSNCSESKDKMEP